MRLNVTDCGLLDYEEALAFQKDLRAKRMAGRIPDTLVLLEHPPVITLGRRAENADVLISRETAALRGVKIVRIDRGGEVTYHGPGQLVGYLVCGLEISGGSVKRFVRQVEEALILCLEKGWGVRAGRKQEYIGVWAGEEKIAAIGLSISRRITMHGFALNINTALEHFQWIVPCGIRAKTVTSLRKILGREIPIGDVKSLLAAEIREVFGYE
jgi:lipoyl(octanoyl) transferase